MGLENLRVVSLAFLTSLTLAACASRAVTPPENKADERPTEKSLSEREQLSKLQDRVQDLEIRLSALNDKINLVQGVAPSSPATPASTTQVSTTPSSAAAKPATVPATAPAPLPTTVVTAPAAHAHTIPVPKSKTEVFVQDEPVDRYREAKILFDSKRFSDALVEFSSFVKTYPDHVLAAAAQYHVGMAYLNQKEYKLAEEELSRELMAYPHSQFTPDTLLALADVSASLKKPSRVLYFKEKLLTLFPHSPQAKGVSLDKPPTTKKEELKEEEELISPAELAVDTPDKPLPPVAPLRNIGDNE